VEDLSDNEREEQLRRWWSENWLWIVGGVALGLGGLAGWQFWQKTRLQSAEKDEAAYLAELQSLSAHKLDEAAKTADDLRAVHPKSPYADQADLALARALVDDRKYDDAAKRLRAVMTGSRDPELRQIATSRLARVLAEQGKHDEALALLDPAQAGAFAPLYQELRGDVLAAKGDADGARQAYDAAIAASSSASAGLALDTEYLELKRDALAPAGRVADATAPAVTVPTTEPAGTKP
jgi:predicted negative regulator of RcsB-dependent stress response